jgi:hypothetical protein
MVGMGQKDSYVGFAITPLFGSSSSNIIPGMKLNQSEVSSR